MTTKQDQLKQLRDRMQQDMSLPLRADATQLVFGEGNPDAKLYFLGEAPGQSEDKQGRPFVGRAGKLLNTLLEGISMQRADVYISNIVRFRPPNNRPPTPAEIAAFLPYVNEEIAIIQPLLIVTLGDFPWQSFYQRTKLRRRMERFTPWTGKGDRFMSSLCIIRRRRFAVQKCGAHWKRISIKYLLSWHSYNLRCCLDLFFLSRL